MLLVGDRERARGSTLSLSLSLSVPKDVSVLNICFPSPAPFVPSKKPPPLKQLERGLSDNGIACQSIQNQLY